MDGSGSDSTSAIGLATGDKSGAAGEMSNPSDGGSGSPAIAAATAAAAAAGIANSGATSAVVTQASLAAVPAKGPTKEEAAKPAPPVWPMPVDEFLAGNYLERADVVLMRRKGDIFSKLIRWATRSHFSHAAMVFVAPHREPEYNNTFVIEAGTSGVAVTDVKHYVTDVNSVVAIRRLRQSWFDPPKHALVRGHMLNSIKARYSYLTAVEVLRRLWFRTRRVVQSQDSVLASYKKMKRQPPNEFICSGLVQLGYANVVGDLIKAKQLPPSALKQVLFGQDFVSTVPDDWGPFTDREIGELVDAYLDQLADDLKGITPQELAVTPNLDWLYVIRNGLVFRVSSAEETQKLLYWRARQPKASAHLALGSGQDHYPA